MHGETIKITNFNVRLIYFLLTNMKEFSELNHLSSAQKNHSKSQTHVHCYLQLNYLEKRLNLLYAERKNDITRHNKQVRINIWNLWRFIDAVWSLGNQEFEFPNHDESSSSLITGNCMEFLKSWKTVPHYLKII